MNKYLGILVTVLLSFLISCTGYKYAEEISPGDSEHHLKYLASDDLQGRYPGTPGDALAGEYIESRFRELNLKSIKQEFSFLNSVKKGQHNMLEIEGRAASPDQYTPFAFSTDTLAEAPLVFAGYGIAVKTDTFEWDDYKGLDVKGKWVLVLRGSPAITGVTDYLSMAEEDRDKAMLAGDKGAAGLILVSGYQFDKEDNLVKVSAKGAAVGIPVIQIKRALADSLLLPFNKNIADLESLIPEGRQSFSFQTSVMVKARTDIENVMGNTTNRYAIVEGTDPVLKDEYVVVGAHYDHLGNGGPGSSSRRPDLLQVHNGADDNASGVTAMLELAGRLKKDQPLLKRSVILVAFGAEEMGLLGSKYFVNHLPVELSKIVAMVNLDMVGRLDTARGIQIGGTGTSSEADSLIDLANKPYSLKLSKSREGSGPSDHSSFYGRNIPVFFLTTGAHTDYHTPDDDADRINIQGLQTVTHLAYRLIMEIADHPDRLTYQEAGPKESATPNYRFKVTLGFMPDFTNTEIEGVRVDFVTKGKAAERGGIKNGDIIKAIDGLAIRNIYDYMYRLGKLSKNQIISVEILRNGKKEILVIQL